MIIVLTIEHVISKFTSPKDGLNTLFFVPLLPAPDNVTVFQQGNEHNPADCVSHRG